MTPFSDPPKTPEARDPMLDGRSKAEDAGDGLHHVNARHFLYPSSSVTRFPVPDEKVPWEVSGPARAWGDSDWALDPGVSHVLAGWSWVQSSGTWEPTARHPRARRVRGKATACLSGLFRTCQAFLCGVCPSGAVGTSSAPCLEGPTAQGVPFLVTFGGMGRHLGVPALFTAGRVPHLQPALSLGREGGEGPGGPSGKVSVGRRSGPSH